MANTVKKYDLSEPFRHLTPEQGVALAIELIQVNEQQAAEIINASVGTLQQWRSRRKGPEYRKIGTRVVYPLKSLKLWLENQPVTETR